MTHSKDMQLIWEAYQSGPSEEEHNPVPYEAVFEDLVDLIKQKIEEYGGTEEDHFQSSQEDIASALHQAEQYRAAEAIWDVMIGDVLKVTRHKHARDTETDFA